MKIGVSHINGTNHGDQIIFQTFKYLLEKSLEENDIEAEVVPFDISLTEPYSTWKRRAKRLRRRPTFRLKDKMRRNRLKKVRELVSTETNPEKCEALLKEQWELMPERRFFLEGELVRIQDADLVILGGGGTIKYHQQHFHFIIDEVTRLCDEKGIPVIICSAGVEGYEEGSCACQFLKRALNRDCVKYVSTRDDYDTLMKFIERPDIETELVCDPAFWTAERYRLKRLDPPEKTIGINAIRSAIWKDYLYEVDFDQLAQMYHDLVFKILDAGYRVEFYSNGAASDNRYIRRIVNLFPDILERVNQGDVTLFFPSQPRRLAKRIAQYERFMAVRLHGSIIGTSMGVPNVSLVWNVKQPLFGQQTKTVDNFITKENFDAGYVFEKLMAAQPYQMDEKYKNSIYECLNRQIVTYCKQAGE